MRREDRHVLRPSVEEFSKMKGRRPLPVIGCFILLLVFVVTILAFNLIPWDIRRYLGYIVIPAGALWYLWQFFKYLAKRRGDQNELDVLEETVQMYERGTYDNTEYIKKQIFFIERDHKPTPEIQRLLERARRAVQ